MGNKWYRVGRALGEAPQIFYIAALFALGLWLWPSKPSQPPTTAPRKVTTTSEERCTQQRNAILQKAREQLDAGDAWQAYQTARACSKTINDSELEQLETKAIAQHRLMIAKDKTRPPDERLAAIQSLEALDPTASKELTPIKKALQAQRDKQQRIALEQEAKEKRKHGVSIGMTQDDVLASSWGKPDRISRTTTARGISEQWAYPGGEYLYFDDGVLTTIRTRR